MSENKKKTILYNIFQALHQIYGFLSRKMQRFLGERVKWGFLRGKFLLYLIY